MNWEKYFDTLDDWKKLPAYRAEPRIDSLIGFYLPEFISEQFNDEINGIIPELPLRLATIKPEYEGTTFADRSYKVDFYLLGKSGTHYFIEFKTDSKSRNNKQDKYLQSLEQIEMKKIVDGILRIASVSPYKIKYNHLLEKLKTLKLIDDENNYIGQTGKNLILYLQPNNYKQESNCLDFQTFIDWLEKKDSVDQFEIEFIKLLKSWSKD